MIYTYQYQDDGLQIKEEHIFLNADYNYSLSEYYLFSIYSMLWSIRGWEN